MITIDLNVAKEIWINKWREARAPILEKLDIEYIRADELGNNSLKGEIASLKQQLRDITLIQLPDNLKDIKKIWPEVLNTAANFNTQVLELSS